MALKSETDTAKLQAAIDTVHNTPHSRRARFAAEIWERRRAHGTDRQIPF